ncbi:hypothetical protein WN51_13145 [Melipona quadrifasciata]|uniref:Uncharacterized protein n=1 Tax=Melipona quadrifasciata TaxID=166423 RepID=A0A0M9A0A4_9HYME|nr:hypothetical protein WN51_13145 [Melipona quadrifasciata]
MSVDTNHYTTRDVAKIPNILKSSVENHSKALGYASKLDVWIFHLFCSLQNSSRGKIFNSDDIKQYLDQFFAAKD